MLRAKRMKIIENQQNTSSIPNSIASSHHQNIMMRSIAQQQPGEEECPVLGSAPSFSAHNAKQTQKLEQKLQTAADEASTKFVVKRDNDSGQRHFQSLFVVETTKSFFLFPVCCSVRAPHACALLEKGDFHVAVMQWTRLWKGNFHVVVPNLDFCFNIMALLMAFDAEQDEDDLMSWENEETALNRCQSVVARTLMRTLGSRRALLPAFEVTLPRVSSNWSEPPVWKRVQDRTSGVFVVNEENQGLLLADATEAFCA
jgi:hypothetical protein